jgi:hypothetical protein
MDDQLQRLIELQTEQNELLKKHLTRLKFSLASLLLLTTAICFGLGFVVRFQYYPVNRPVPAPVYSAPTLYGTIQPAPTAPTGTFQVYPTAPSSGNDNPFVK